MKSNIFKSNTQRAIAMAALAISASAWSSGAIAKDLDMVRTAHWVSAQTASTRNNARAVNWSEGWNKCRAANMATRSIYVKDAFVEYMDKQGRKKLYVRWGCWSTDRAPADEGRATF